jgi:AraC family transcriptional regulator, regulatory protein of adaptative response / methylated-DNA-[protein]-cysteine methyltransferase
MSAAVAERGVAERRRQDERRWRAVLARDPRFDGAFVFGVRSTGIYCRPSCPARRPRRRNVVFFPVAEAAEGAGFRSCRRCRPREASPRDREAARVRTVCRRIEAAADSPLSLARLGAEVGWGPHHLQRTFKRIVGVSPRQYKDALRLRSLRAGLRKGDPVTTAIYDAGFGSSSRVYERAPGRLGMTPATYRRGGRGMRLAYAVAPSPLGRLLVAATERGVSAVRLGDSDAALQASLREEFPAAEIRRDPDGVGAWLKAVLERIEGGPPHADLPLDIRGTAFQERVWDALRAIPFGEVRSYGEVARGLGQPKAARAVARACATNPVAVVIPCHRVVPGSGGAGGYRWGAERKRRLLEREKAAAVAGRSRTR